MPGDGNKIDRLNTLIELVRTTSARSKESTDKPSASKKPTQPAVPQSQPHDMGELRRRIMHRLSDDDKQPPLSSERASAVIVREILLWEFGAQLENHSEFGAMLGMIEKTLDENPALKKKMASLVEEFKQLGD